MPKRKPSPWQILNADIDACRSCDRLIRHCQQVAEEKRAAYRDEDYWGGPVSNFGDPKARLLIVGLAPGAHGANRTGRMFTGDRSGDWLFKSLHKMGFANQAEAISLKDGLKLKDCAITNACHCAPPGNKPTADELTECSDFLCRTLDVLPVKVIVALGGIAWTAIWKHFQAHCPDAVLPTKKPKFGHNEKVQLTDSIVLLGSYHPSQQNTFTGRLTEPMLNNVFRKAKRLIQ